MRSPRTALALLLLLWALPCRAADVLVLQSGRSAAYEEALAGFREEYRGSSRTVVLSDYAEVDAVRLVKEERPKVVLAVGDAALAASRKVRQVPVVSLLALALNLGKEPSGTVGGVGVMPSPDRYLELFRALGVSRVGVVHDPSRTGRYVHRARQAAGRFGIELVVREVRASRETPARIEQLRGEVDALWMLPDSTAVSAETLDGWFLFSLREKVPVVTFSERYLSRGAAVSLDVDRAELGRQAAELAKSVAGGETRGPASLDARKVAVGSNPTVVRTLGLTLPEPGR